MKEAPRSIDSTSTVSSVQNALNVRLYVDTSDLRGERLIAAGGDLNPLSLRLWNLLVGRWDWDLIVDVGANYGEMILGAVLPGRARAVAFEPYPEVHALLSRSVHESGRDVEVVPEAVGDYVGTVALFRDENWSGKSSTIIPKGSPAAQETVVAITTLDEYFAGDSYPSACVKVDVEGAELSVLAGASAFIESVDEIAFLIEALHLSNEEIARLAREWQVFAFDGRYSRLIRVLGSERVVAEVLRGGWCYPQDIVLVPRGRPLPWRKRKEAG